MTFKNEQYKNAAKELDNPDLDGWEFVVESHGIKIYRFLRQPSGLYEYKVIGVANIKAETCAEVYMDIAYRKTWDSYVKELTYISKANPTVIYWEVDYPWPMSNRDYVFLREMDVCTDGDKKVWTILGRSAKANELSQRKVFHCLYFFLRCFITDKFYVNVTNLCFSSAKANELSQRQQVDEKKGVIRVRDYEQSMVIRENQNGTSQIFMHYYDDPRGMIPTMVVNWAAKTGVPGFLTTLEEACKIYDKTRNK
uniref:Phosphatidylcholine transfer protein n=1 Tax=Phallusia mammillata TaxID=59560 RepID=A0A6F9DUX1_9ASCI|nr:phosphatidylcholine transfer protein-like [Phallusia mammillata]